MRRMPLVVLLAGCAAAPRPVLHEPGPVADRCHELIEILASSGSDERKRDALRELTALGRAAMPCLLEHWNDERYAMEMVSPYSQRPDLHCCVGELMSLLFCHDILCIAPVGIADPAAWWREHRNDSLEAMRADLDSRRPPPPDRPH